MNKALVFTLYVVALTVVLREYYKTESGIPKPWVIRNPTYLYGILILASDFLGGIPIVVALALTVALIWQTQNANQAQQNVKPTAKSKLSAPQKVSSKNG